MFAVPLFGAAVEQGRLICERIRMRLAATERRSTYGAAIRGTVTAGIAPLSGGQPPKLIMAAAETAIYRAKDEGRNGLALAA